MITALFKGEPVGEMIRRLRVELDGVNLKPRVFMTKREKKSSKEARNEIRKKRHTEGR